MNILICPLEWGSGHAGRMLPVASRLVEMGHKVIFASGRGHLEFIKSEMPSAGTIEFPGFSPVYSRFLPQYAAILLQVPVLIYHILKEHYALKRILSKYEIDLVISDNRFGLWNRKVRSVYVTHQVRIPFPGAFSWLEPAGVRLHRLILKRYDYCLIPDLPGLINLSGRMSHNVRLPANVRFTGILSRFSGEDPELPEKDQTIIILSGPEPQKSILKKKLLSIGIPGEVVVLEGRPGAVLKKHMLESKRIIARAGYSTIMELISLGCPALLIPTPGQTEQEYLATYLSGKGWFTMSGQHEIGSTPMQFTGRITVSREIAEISRKLLNDALKEITGI